MESSHPCHRQHAKKSDPLFEKRSLPSQKRSRVLKYPWRHSLQSGTSAFHGLCRTSTAKLRSRFCRGGESCMRSFDLLRLYMICISYALQRLARLRAREGKSDPPSALSALLSYRSVHEGVRRELLAPGRISLSEKYHRRNSRETLIKSLSDFILGFLYRARNHLTRIASYLRRMMTKLCIKIHMKFDSAI